MSCTPRQRAETERHLGEIADLLVYLPLMVDTRNPLEGDARRRGPRSRPPLNLEPIDLSDETHAILTSWVHLAHEEQLAEPDDWPADNSLACCLWLQRHNDALCDHEAADEWRAEIRTLWRRVRWAVGERTPKRPRCTAVHDTQRCNNLVDGINADGDRTEVMEHWTWCRCPACGATYTFDAALRRLGQLQTQTLQAWAAELGIESNTLRMRLDRAGFLPDGYDHRHRRLYDRETIKRVMSLDLPA